jgi:hypothetical protein
MKRVIFIVLALAGTSFSFCQIPAIEYFGQTPPGDSAIIFEPGIISKAGRFEHAAIFSRDGKEFYFSETPDDWVFRNTWIRKHLNNVWTEEKPASFSTRHIGGESTISYTNDSLIYTDGTDLWIVIRNDSGWNDPFKLPLVINSFDVQWHPTIASNGNIYFSSKGNIYISEKKNNQYQTPELLPAPVNSSYWDADPVIAPDGSYIIFNSNRPGSSGDADLYISYRRSDGNWTNPKNLGARINSEKMDDASSVTPDGKYFFFSRRTNQECDIYWVRSNFIDSLKHTNFIPYSKTPIPDQTDTAGCSINYIIPDKTFVDDDGNNTLTYSAVLSDDSPLPLWLGIDSTTGTFTGMPTKPGTFSIKVTARDNINATVSSTFTMKIIAIASMKQVLEQNIQVYPNPAKDKIYLTFGSAQFKNMFVEITDINGKLTSSFTYHNRFHATIDMKFNSTGVYFLRLNVDGEVIYKKICLN